MTSLSFDSIDELVPILKFFQKVTNKVNLVCDSNGILISNNQNTNTDTNTDTSNDLFMQAYIPKYMLKNYLCPSKIIQGIDLPNFINLIMHINLLEEVDRKNITFFIGDYDICTFSILVVSEDMNTQRLYKMCELPRPSILPLPDIQQCNYDYVFELSTDKLHKTCLNILNASECIKNQNNKNNLEDMMNPRKRLRQTKLKSCLSMQANKNVELEDNDFISIRIKKDSSTTSLIFSTMITDPHFAQEISIKVNDISPCANLCEFHKPLFIGHYNIQRFVTALSPCTYYPTVKIFLKQHIPLYFQYEEICSNNTTDIMHDTSEIALQNKTGIKTKVYIKEDERDNRTHNY